MKTAPQFKTEADLCATFTEAATPLGWTSYNETEGWDILLVHGGDGTQIGVQAKLKFNRKVLAQAIEYGNGWHDVGPDFRAILLPARECDSEDLCAALGLTVLEVEVERWGERRRIIVRPELDAARHYHRGWHFCNPAKRCPLPAIVPDVAAGVPGPSQLTTWKLAALRVCAVLELRGWVTRQDFRLAGVDHRRWTQHWLEPMPDRPGAWRRRHDAPDFAAKHPTVYPKVLAEVKEKGLALAPALL